MGVMDWQCRRCEGAASKLPFPKLQTHNLEHAGNWVLQLTSANSRSELVQLFSCQGAKVLEGPRGKKGA